MQGFDELRAPLGIVGQEGAEVLRHEALERADVVEGREDAVDAEVLPGQHGGGGGRLLELPREQGLAVGAGSVDGLPVSPICPPCAEIRAKCPLAS